MSNNHEISLQVAIDMTALYRANRPDNSPICETFDTDAVNKLLAIENCKFLRIYYGMKDNLEVDAILVAADADGKDILPDNETIKGDNIIILEDGFRCPPICPPTSKLNGG